MLPIYPHSHQRLSGILQGFLGAGSLPTFEGNQENKNHNRQLNQFPSIASLKASLLTFRNVHLLVQSLRQNIQYMTRVYRRNGKLHNSSAIVSPYLHLLLNYHTLRFLNSPICILKNTVCWGVEKEHI